MLPMIHCVSSLLLPLLFPALCIAAATRRDDIDVNLGGRTFVNKGLVAFGLIPSNARESTGDTIGGIGSAIALKPGSWKPKDDGKFEGTLIVHPDRGFNIEGTVDYQARQHEIDFVLDPYDGTDDLSFDDAQKTLQLIYKSTVLQTERLDAKTTGLDGLGVRPATLEDPQLPVGDGRLSIDAEGLVANEDGTFWLSDEYGPYIYRFSADGKLLSAIQPPDAVLPRDKNGNLNFTSLEDLDDVPTTGRSPNQGFEGLTLDTENGILYAMLQSATIQDGGPEKKTNRYTRLFGFDISLRPPKPVGEWVVPLPQSKKGNTRACSEIYFLGDGVFLAMSRDGDGKGSDETESGYKQVDLFDISEATDIHGTKFDDPENPVSPDGQLDNAIEPAEYVDFINMLDEDELGRFSLHNGGDNDETLIAAKWESLALAPANDDNNLDDYFLIVAADNDFVSTDGVSLGQSFDAGLDIDNQFLVYRITVPGLTSCYSNLHKGCQYRGKKRKIRG